MQTKYTKHLGGNLQDNLHWQANLLSGDKALIPTIKQKLGALKLIGKTMPRTCKQTLVNAQILSRIIYLIPVCGGAHPKYLRQVQSALNQAATFITNRSKKKNKNNGPNGRLWMVHHQRIGNIPLPSGTLENFKTGETRTNER